VPKTPIISGDDLIKALIKAGFQIIRSKGSHVSLNKGEYNTVVPLHDEISKGTLFGILHQCGLTKNDLIELIKK
jgi:predicted RNA binding protein YcfA (HicA-like mRNA interferase family)